MKLFGALVFGGFGLVAAHGYVDNATIGGQYYQFYQVGLRRMLRTPLTRAAVPGSVLLNSGRPARPGGELR
jgi:hypothetical protein